jgi:hypothetical protein
MRYAEKLSIYRVFVFFQSCSCLFSMGRMFISFNRVRQRIVRLHFISYIYLLCCCCCCCWKGGPRLDKSCWSEASDLDGPSSITDDLTIVVVVVVEVSLFVVIISLRTKKIVLMLQIFLVVRVSSTSTSFLSFPLLITTYTRAFEISPFAATETKVLRNYKTFANS